MPLPPKSLRLLLVAGARPNFMKIAPLIRAIEASNARRNPDETHFEWRLVHTGQHYDGKMSQIFFEELQIPSPQVTLEVGSGSHAVQTARVMERFEPVCNEYKPDWVVVVGDVNSTVACALVATKLGIRVAHVEAGLRSYDRTMPEEINRIVTDAISDFLLTPSEDANDNLRREGVPEAKIRLVGNIMIDTLVDRLETSRRSTIIRHLQLEPKQFAYVTLHRPANVDDRATLAAIIAELKELSIKLPVVFPIHPRTWKMMSDFGLSANGASALRVIEPIGYLDSLALTENARLVLTDSGGLQEESTYFNTPCLTLRPNTERPVTVTIGSNRLTNIENLSADLAQTLNGRAKVGQVPPLWDGRTAPRILSALTGDDGC